MAASVEPTFAAPKVRRLPPLHLQHCPCSLHIPDGCSQHNSDGSRLPIYGSPGTGSSTTSVPTMTPTACQDLSYICFSGNSLVDVADKGLTRMDELKTSVLVLAIDGTFSKECSFSHYDSTFKTPFLQILTNTMDKKHPLEISMMLLLYIQDGSSKGAKTTLVLEG